MARITHHELIDIANVTANMNGYEAPESDGNVWFGDGRCEVFNRNDELIGHLVRSAENGWEFEAVDAAARPSRMRSA